MWEDTGRGRPLLSQLSCGGGEPVATHSNLTESSRTEVNCSTLSLLPSITGGTKKKSEENKLKTTLHSAIKQKDQNVKNVFTKKSNPPNTFRLNILSSSPALLVATQVYFPLSAVWALITVSVLPSGLILNTNVSVSSWDHLSPKWPAEKLFYFFSFCGNYYPKSLLLVWLMTSPSFNHWIVGVGVPLAWQTSWMLSFISTPISLGSSDPEILGGTKR